MIVTRMILGVFALVVGALAIKDSQGVVGVFFVSDFFLAIMVFSLAVRMRGSLKVFYRRMAILAFILSISYLARLILANAWYPFGYMWCFSMAIALLTFVKSLQDI